MNFVILLHLLKTISTDITVRAQFLVRYLSHYTQEIHTPVYLYRQKRGSEHVRRRETFSKRIYISHSYLGYARSLFWCKNMENGFLVCNRDDRLTISPLIWKRVIDISDQCPSECTEKDLIKVVVSKAKPVICPIRTGSGVPSADPVCVCRSMTSIHFHVYSQTRLLPELADDHHTGFFFKGVITLRQIQITWVVKALKNMMTAQNLCITGSSIGTFYCLALTKTHTPLEWCNASLKFLVVLIYSYALLPLQKETW